MAKLSNRFWFQLHGWFSLPVWIIFCVVCFTGTIAVISRYSIGYYLVTIMAIVMLVFLVSGLLIYRKFWRSFTQPKLRLNQGKKTVFADLHRLEGGWSIWFLLLMSITGLWYLFQAVLWHDDVDIDPHAPIVAIEQLPKNTNEVPVANTTLTDALALAKQRFNIS